MFGFMLATPLAILAWSAVGLVYGQRWQAAAPALAALAVLGGLRILFDLVYDLLAGVGRTTSLLVVQLAWFAGLLVALLIGATVGGIGGVGVAHLVVAVGLVGPLYLTAIARSGIAVRAVLSALAPAAYAAAAVRPSSSLDVSSGGAGGSRCSDWVRLAWWPLSWWSSCIPAVVASFATSFCWSASRSARSARLRSARRVRRDERPARPSCAARRMIGAA